MRTIFLLTAGLTGLLFAAGVSAADLRVPGTHPSIAAALASAQPGDRVIVAPGTYFEHDLDLAPGVTLIGDPDDPGRVVIDAGGQGRVLRAEGLDDQVVVSSLTLTGGHAQGETHYRRSGGGILISHSAVRLANVRLTANLADGSGGAIRGVAATLELAGCVLADNAAGEGGGGLDASYGTASVVTQCTFRNNQAAWGGGTSVRAPSPAEFLDCTFVANRTSDETGLGGAVATDLGATPSFTRCVMTQNVAGYGGAVFSSAAAAPTLTNVTLHDNDAHALGGGLYCNGGGVTLDHTIISFHDESAIACIDDAPWTVTACDIYGNQGGDWTGPLTALLGTGGNMSEDPLYCDAVDLTLQDISPCAPARSGVGLIGALDVACAGGVDVPEPVAPAAVGAQPNPFNPRTELVFRIPRAGRVRLAIYDLQGRLVDLLVDEKRPPGEHRLVWDARDRTGHALASGTYLMVMETGGQRVTEKLALVR